MARSLLAVVLATAVLYFAREVLIPLALALLVSFLLAPLVRQLERLGVWRVAATLLVVMLGFSGIGAVFWIAGNQAISLAAKLPEYRQNIVKKIRAVRAPQSGDLGKAAEAIKDLQKEASAERAPLPVTETAGTPLQALAEFIAPVAKPAATALAVIVFTVLMLLNRENLRDRMIVLLGPGRIQLTTRAMGEAAGRVSRYLGMQLLVNALFGIPFGIALHFIGIPNALLFGLLGVVLRFIPYAGVWIAAAMPAALAFAIADDWSMVAWTLGVFLAIEMLLVNAVEPWLYGRSAGLSPMAIILAAIFWTWLWGPIGLLLATPLTVCVAVMGRYVPEFGYLNVILGVEPVLSDDARLYQRLVALDDEEAAELLEKHARMHGLADAFDSVLRPALALAERDRHKGAIEPARERFILERAKRLVEIGRHDEPALEGGAAPLAYVVPATDEADHVAGLALARLLASTGVR
ncbi:MAG: AI-2E family transporter, partial [Betaproteobacteria bacterium]